jgi:hypothetical protein
MRSSASALIPAFESMSLRVFPKRCLPDGRLAQDSAGLLFHRLRFWRAARELFLFFGRVLVRLRRRLEHPPQPLVAFLVVSHPSYPQGYPGRIVDIDAFSGARNPEAVVQMLGRIRRRGRATVSKAPTPLSTDWRASLLPEGSYERRGRFRPVPSSGSHPARMGGNAQ